MFGDTKCTSCEICEDNSPLGILGFAMPQISLNCTNIDPSFEIMECVDPTIASIETQVLLLDSNVTRTRESEITMVTSSSATGSANKAMIAVLTGSLLLFVSTW